MLRMRRRLCLWLGLFAVLGGCGDLDPETTVVARAGDAELTVEGLAQLLAPAELGTDERVVRTLADLWVDYTLLAKAMAKDSALAHLELGPLAEQRAGQGMLAPLRDSVIQAIGTIPEAELRRRYEREAPGSEIRARQILIMVPYQASPAERDGAREAIEALRARIVEGGEDFATLARLHSQDQRTARAGGDMGFFGRGEMLPPFEEAALALEPGEVSEPVETSYGWHLIRLEERRTPTLGEFREQIRREALSRFLDELEERAAPRIEPRAVNAVWRLARNPAVPPGMETDTLVPYVGGGVTAQQLLEHLRSQPPQTRSEIAGAAPDRIVVGVLRPLVRQQLLDAEARRRGLAPGPREIEAEAAELRRGLQNDARELGLISIHVEGDEGRAEAPREPVRELLGQIARNERQVTDLGPLSHILRDHYGFEIRGDRMPLVLTRLEELRRQDARPAS